MSFQAVTKSKAFEITQAPSIRSDTGIGPSASKGDAHLSACDARVQVQRKTTSKIANFRQIKVTKPGGRIPELIPEAKELSMNIFRLSEPCLKANVGPVQFLARVNHNGPTVFKQLKVLTLTGNTRRSIHRLLKLQNRFTLDAAPPGNQSRFFKHRHLSNFRRELIPDMMKSKFASLVTE